MAVNNEASQVWMVSAQLVLSEQGRQVENLSHRHIIDPKFGDRHLFRGKEAGKTVRFQGVVKGGVLVGLWRITNNERKHMGRFDTNPERQAVPVVRKVIEAGPHSGVVVLRRNRGVAGVPGTAPQC